jgi:hypothetical protein
MKTNAATPLACNLSIFTPEQRHEHEENCWRLFHQASNIRELPGGLALHLPNERGTLSLATEFVTREAQCCPFLDFDLHWEPPYGHVELSITGPEGSREFLKAEFAGLLRD